MQARDPRRGEVWFADLDPAPPARGHEQAYPRPVLVISVNSYNRDKARLVVVLPITRTDWKNRAHIPLQPPEGGLVAASFILCDQVRTISQLRLRRPLGNVSPTTVRAVEDWLSFILGI